MEEIRGTRGSQHLAEDLNVPDQVLSSYLKQEHPQTAAVVLSKIQSSQAARVIKSLPHELAIDIVNRVLIMENVPKDALNRIEHTLAPNSFQTCPPARAGTPTSGWPRSSTRSTGRPKRAS